MTKFYVVIDTNVLVAAMLKWNSMPGNIVALAFEGPIIPILDTYILKEYRDVLLRPKFHLTDAIVDPILERLEARGVFVDPESLEIDLPDPKDRVFYEVVMEERKKEDAFLETGNIRHFPTAPFIVTPRQMSDIIFCSGKQMQLEQCPLSGGGSLPLLTFPALTETGIVKHGFTTRLGGVSEGIFSSLNLGFARGDDPDAVRENFRRAAEALDVDLKRFVCTHQTHTTNVRVVTEADAGKGVTKERAYRDVDGLVTDVPGLVLAAFFADCVPLYFVDPVHRAIGLSHSGWKGTVGRMGARTLAVMADAYGTRPEDVICAIGPSICRDCYEVSGDVAEKFAEEFAGHESEILRARSGREAAAACDTEGSPAAARPAILRADAIRQAGQEQKYLLDLWRANAIVLTDAGVRPEHLSVTDICTCCNPDLLFSHRASHGKRGNLGAFFSISI